MARDDWREGGGERTLVSALKEVFADLGELVHNELRLAKTELALAIGGAVKAGVWMAVAAVLGFIALLFLLQGVVFGLAGLGLGLGWASLIVGVALVAGAAGAFFYGRSLVKPLAPSRTIQQINSDVAALREQLS
jgi:hypothetical protein